MSNQIINHLIFLLKENIDFKLAVKCDEIIINPVNMKSIFKETFILLNLSGFSLDLNKEYFYFKSYLKDTKTEATMKIYYNTISQIIVNNEVVLNNLCVLSEEKKYLQELRKGISKNIFLTNNQNQKY